MHRVAIADDHPAVRRALVASLSGDGRFDVVGAVSTADAAVALVRDHLPDLVVLDVRMPGGGPAAASAISALELSRPPVVVALSADASLVAVLSMLRAGATSYVRKGQPGLELPEVLDRCAHGEHLLIGVPRAEKIRQLLLDDQADSTHPLTQARSGHHGELT